LEQSPQSALRYVEKIKNALRTSAVSSITQIIYFNSHGRIPTASGYTQLCDFAMSELFSEINEEKAKSQE